MKPFLQQPFKEESTALTSPLPAMTRGEGMSGGCSQPTALLTPQHAARDLLCLLISHPTWRMKSFAQVQLHQIPGHKGPEGLD